VRHGYSAEYDKLSRYGIEMMAPIARRLQLAGDEAGRPIHQARVDVGRLQV
jgi:hypothetical protein